MTGTADDAIADLVASRVIDVPDFPQPGIVFKDLSPLFADPYAFRRVVEAVVKSQGPDRWDAVAGIEARGFLLAAPVAYVAGAGLVLVRKAGKLPRATHAATYALEYGEATVEIHQDAVAAGQRVLVVDDVLATGGTVRATVDLLQRAGGVVTGVTVLLELGFLDGRSQLPDHPLSALLTV